MTALVRPALPAGAMSAWLPVWLRDYRRADVPRDVIAGLVTAVLLIPQSMAYAQLAGLPPQVGLYASVLPLAIYAMLGTSRQLSVGPVAITSLLVYSGVSALAAPGTARFVELALVLALLVGAAKLLMGVLRLGELLNFIAHPVLAAFTSASALIIAAGQLKHILGVPVGGDRLHQVLAQAAAQLGRANPATLAIGLMTVALLVGFRKGLRPALARTRLRPLGVTLIVSAAPLVTVVLGTLVTWLMRLDASAGVAVVGAIPLGLSPFRVPHVAWPDVAALGPAAAAIVLVSVVESIAVAKSLASKRRQAIDPNRELVALGAANLAAGLFSGYPVTGGFARSVVNDQAGAVSGAASLVTAGAIAVILLFFTPLFAFLPQAVLAATVIVAVAGLVDLAEPRRIWRANRGDAVVWAMTFAAVLALGVERGIFAGVGTSLALLLWRSSRPHIAVVGRLGESEVYRNVLRHAVTTWPHVVAVRIDESLFFANTRFLEQALLKIVADRPAVRHLVLIGSAINFIDSSALHTLESLLHELRDGGVELHLAEIKGPVMDGLERTDFLDHLGRDHVHLTTDRALRALGCDDEPQDDGHEDRHDDLHGAPAPSTPPRRQPNATGSHTRRPPAPPVGVASPPGVVALASGDGVAVGVAGSGVGVADSVGAVVAVGSSGVSLGTGNVGGGPGTDVSLGGLGSGSGVSGGGGNVAVGVVVALDTDVPVPAPGVAVGSGVNGGGGGSKLVTPAQSGSAPVVSGPYTVPPPSWT